jgi:uncharacterized protein (TIGR04255 family)
MSDLETFPNAPITEAILDIKAELPEGTPIEALGEFQKHVKNRFPDRSEKRSLQTQFRFSPGKDESTPVSSEDKIEGYNFISHPDKKVVQIKLDGFTFNKLHPYEDWEKFSSEGRELWELYEAIVKPISVSRIALRYINQIEIPLPFNNLNEYICTMPHIASGIPHALSSFFMRLEIPNKEIGAMAILTEFIQKPSESQKLPLILDIDVFRADSQADIRPDMWEVFTSLRDFKNEIFSSSITDKTRELFR